MNFNFQAYKKKTTQTYLYILKRYLNFIAEKFIKNNIDYSLLIKDTHE